MSRSYKKYPHWTMRSTHSGWFRRQHAKKVRKNWDIPDGGAYKRLVCIWDLEDWKSVEFRNRESIPDDVYYSRREGRMVSEPQYSEKYWRQGRAK